MFLISSIDWFSIPSQFQDQNNLSCVIKVISDALKNNSIVRKVALNQLRLSPGDTLAIGDMLRVNTKLEFINLRQSLDSSCAALPIVALMDNVAVEEALLGRNSLGEPAGSMIGALLRHNRTLRSLDLRESDLREESIRQLCIGLSDNSTLEGIYLDNTRLGACGGIQLSEMLEELVFADIGSREHVFKR